jgi:hypothetical protein
MLEKSIISLTLPLAPEGRGEGMRGNKEDKHWQPIYQLLNGQSKVRKGGFEISTSKLQ